MKSTIGRLFAVKTALSFGTQFWGFAAYTVFFAPWLASRGVAAAEIAFILALAQFVKSISGPIGALFADGFEHKKTPVLIMNLLTTLSVVALYFVDQYWTILIVIVLFSMVSAAIVPILEGLTIKGADKFGFDFGRVRLWGSLSFVFSSYACGKLIDIYDFDILISWLLFGAVTSTFASLFLPVLPQDDTQKLQKKVKKFDLAGAILLIKHPIFITILVAVSFVQSSHAVYYGFSAIHWAEIGYSGELIGILWAVAVLAEVVLFMFSSKLTNFLGPRRLLILAAAAAVIRWAILAVDPPLILVFVSQTLHALTFGAVYLGSLNLISRSVPENLISTAMAINVSLNMGLFMAIGFIIAGYLYDDYANGAYWFAVIFGLIGLLMSLGLKFIWNGEALEFTEPDEK
ncbi:MAG: MFS transporter [Alphaproteobacteria bacterium]|nr:MFS transporter [Alphaproteobacteria bacterium]